MCASYGYSEGMALQCGRASLENTLVCRRKSSCKIRTAMRCACKSCCRQESSRCALQYASRQLRKHTSFRLWCVGDAGERALRHEHRVSEGHGRLHLISGEVAGLAVARAAAAATPFVRRLRHGGLEGQNARGKRARLHSVAYVPRTTRHRDVARPRKSDWRPAGAGEGGQLERAQNPLKEGPGRARRLRTPPTHH